MRKISQAIAVVLTLALGLVASPPANAAIIATPSLLASYSSGGDGLFDNIDTGSQIWASSYGPAKVYVFEKSDGTLSHTISLPAGANPKAMCQNSSSVYVTNQGASSVTKIDKATYTSTQISLASATTDLICNDSIVWASSYAGGKIYQLNASTNALMTTVTLSYAALLNTDGTYLYASWSNGTKISKYNFTTGALVFTGSALSFSGAMNDLIYSHSALWVATNFGHILKVSASDGTLISDFSTSSSNAYKVIIYEEAMFVGNGGGSTSYIYDITSGTPVLENNIASAAMGMQFDGSNIWVVNYGAELRKFGAAYVIAAPNQPGTPTATAGNGSASVSWTAPSGGTSVTSYLVTSAPGGQTCTVNAPATTCTVNGLTNGTPYTFTVVAVNSGGNSPASNSSNSVTPVDVAPGAPGTPTATAGDGSAVVSWTAPVSGGAPVSYTVTSAPGGFTCTVNAPATSCEIDGLTNGTDYTFTVTATNTGGTSSASNSSNTVTPQVEAPGAPGTPTATAGDGSAVVSWTAPVSGGAPVSYTVTSAPGGFTCTVNAPATSCEIDGLTNGTEYTFTVTATNLGGTSSASGQSNAVTPEADVFVVTITKSGQGTVTNSTGTIANGSTFTSRATAAKGYTFAGWVCTPDSLNTTGNTISFTVTGAFSCEATFQKNAVVASDLTIIFETDSWKMGTKQATKLYKLVKTIKAAGYTTITITGYTDNLGTAKANKSLSLARAKSVRNFLKKYLPNVQFIVVGAGASNPVASNATEAGRAKNRRAEIAFS